MIGKSQGIDAEIPEPPGEKREVVMATRAESVGESGRWARREQTAMCCLEPGSRLRQRRMRRRARISRGERPRAVVDPAREHGRFPRSDPGPRPLLRPTAEGGPAGDNLTAADELTGGGLDHVADGFLVDVESALVKSFQEHDPPGCFPRRPQGRAQHYASRRIFSSRPYTLKQSTSHIRRSWWRGVAVGGSSDRSAERPAHNPLPAPNRPSTKALASASALRGSISYPHPGDSSSTERNPW